MNELIKIDSDNKVSGRELYKFLELASGQFSRWAKSNITENKFAEQEVDYTGVDIVVEGNNVIDYELSIEFAKKLCMVSHTRRGEQARQYFIECEKQLKSVNKSLDSYMIDDPIERATKWIEEEKERISLRKDNGLLKTTLNSKIEEIEEMAPKANYTDIVLRSVDAVTITQIAKDYAMTAKELNSKLKELHVQYKQSGQWMLYKEHLGFGYTKSNTYTFADGNGFQHTRVTTKWTQKGRLFIYQKLKDDNILPVIEKNS